MSSQKHTLRVPGDLPQVQVLCDFVMSVAQTMGMGDDGIYHCQLSVEEICTNIVEHGYHFDGAGKSIEVVCEQVGDRLRISIWDEAPPFNPLQRPDPKQHNSLDEIMPGGWGIFFVKKFMANLAYHYEDNRNCLTMEKIITSD
jgi:anti-sigma regulatory factor (Ser/Thr protein kinase)